MPPSTVRVAPVTNELSSLARNSALAAAPRLLLLDRS
jgi:hypothetical protein